MHLSLRELCYLEVGLCKRYRKTLQGKQLSLVKKIEVQNEGMKKPPSGCHLERVWEHMRIKEGPV